MPYTMDYTDSTGGNHPASFWIIGPVNIHFAGRYGQIFFFGYHDSDAYDAAGPPLIDSPKQFQVNDPSLFEEFFGKAFTLSAEAFITTLEAVALSTVEPDQPASRGLYSRGSVPGGGAFGFFASATYTVTGPAIASGEAFGVGVVSVTAHGASPVASGEAFPVGYLTVTVTGASIASAEAFGVGTLT